MTIATWSASAEPYAKVTINDGVGGTATIATGKGSQRIEVILQWALLWRGDEKGVQRVWLQKDTDPDSIIPCDYVQCTGDDLIYHADEFGSFKKNDGTSITDFSVFSSRGIAEATQIVRCYFDGITTGANTWNLWIQHMPYWHENHPLAVVFSCYAYQMLQGDAKTWLDQGTFQDLDEYYTDCDFLIHHIPDEGASFGEVAREAMRHTSDWLTIRPDSVDGKVTLHAIGRRFAEERGIIDLDDPDALVDDWEATLRSDYKIKYMGSQYSDSWWFGQTNVADEFKQWPLEMPHDQDKHEMRSDQYDERAYSWEEDLPKIIRRKDIALHFDLNMWRHDQLEISLTMGPLHWNYECGDLCRVRCAQLELIGSGDYEWFVVVKKKVNFKRHTARLTLLRVYGTRGNPPHRDQSTGGNRAVILSTSATLGARPHNTAINSTQFRNWDRWENESPPVNRKDDPYHLTYHTYGTDPLVMDRTTVRNWFPRIDGGRFDLSGSDTGGEYASFLNTTSYYYYFVWVGNMRYGSNQIFLSAGDTTGSYIKFGRINTDTNYYYGYYTDTDGWKQADTSLYEGSYADASVHVITIACGHGGGTDGRVGFNGQWVGSGLTYTTTPMQVDGMLGDDIRSNGTSDIEGCYACVLFRSTSNSTLPDLTWGIEDYFMERFKTELGL